MENITLGLNRGGLHLDAPGVEHIDVDMREVLAQRCHELETKVRFCAIALFLTAILMTVFLVLIWVFSNMLVPR